jgi:hypothetical protein
VYFKNTCIINNLLLTLLKIHYANGKNAGQIPGMPGENTEMASHNVLGLPINQSIN